MKYLRNPGVPWTRLIRKVTIGIGLICKDAIILASDSQTTRGAVKDLHAQKINVVEFADTKIIVAQAGIADLSDVAIESMRRQAHAVHLESVDKVKDIASTALREVRKHFWDLDHLERLSDDECRAYFQGKDFTLLIGLFHERKPHLFTIDLSWCYPVEIKRHYATIGIGAYLADYLIAEYVPEQVEFGDAYPWAVYTVEKVIDNVDGCGRPTWVGFTFPAPEEELKLREQARSKRPVYKTDAVIFKRQEVDLVVSELKEGEAKAKRIQQEYIREVMRNVTKKRLAQMAYGARS